jgi:hypothetical protein
MPLDFLHSTATYVFDPGPATLAHIERLFPWMGANNVFRVTLYNTDKNNILSILHSTQDSSCSDPVLGIGYPDPYLGVGQTDTWSGPWSPRQIPGFLAGIWVVSGYLYVILIENSRLLQLYFQELRYVAKSTGISRKLHQKWPKHTLYHNHEFTTTIARIICPAREFIQFT